MTEVVTEAEFTTAALEFLRANAKPRVEVTTGWGEGSDRVNLLAEKTAEEERAELAEAKAWRQLAFDAGFGGSVGRPEYGGRGLPPSYDRIYQGLEAGFDVPSQSPLRHRSGDGRTDDPRPRHHGREGRLSAGHVARRHRRLPALQ